MKLSDVINPSRVALQIFGINPRSWWAKVYLASILIFNISLILNVYKLYFERLGDNFWFNTCVHMVRDLSRTSSWFAIVVTTLLNPKRYEIPINDFILIDGTLKNLGAQVNNNATHRHLMVRMAFFGAVPILLTVSNFYIYVASEIDDASYKPAIMGGILNLIITYSYGVTDCAFCLVLSIIRERFKAIHGVIRQMSNCRALANFRVIEFSSGVKDEVVFRELEILREQYHELWLIASRANEAYDIYLLFIVPNTLVTSTVLLWETHTVFRTADKTGISYASTRIVWAVFLAIILLILVRACDSTVSEARVTSVVLQELMMKGNHNSKTIDEIRDFLLQIELEIHDFSACRFFSVNAEIICSVLGAVSTYLVILIQMGDDDSL